jgi:hypothetical protein
MVSRPYGQKKNVGMRPARALAKRTGAAYKHLSFTTQVARCSPVLFKPGVFVCLRFSLLEN